MQALGPPEKEARTTGHGLIFSSYISKYKTRQLLANPFKNLSMSIIVLLVKEEYVKCYSTFKEGKNLGIVP